ncbi:MAG: DUF4398 domain-containing protein, partial [Methylococcaceae bacterium]|nr:DUF4398 domain-containing protein [Methylococcaceae bacterium]
MNNNHSRSTQIMRSIGVTAVAAVLVAGCASIPAPTEQIAVSKAAVDSATSAGGNEFAPVQLQSALEKLNAAERAMAEEENLKARQLAEQAQVDAQLAAATARAAKAQ